MATRSFDCLVERVRGLGFDLPDTLILRRTRAGWHQRAAGAWSWYAADSTGNEVLASHYPVSRLVRAERLHVHSEAHGRTLEIDPL